ncbi:MAG: DUF1043 family protein [Halieaceae bacterium]|nr:DUF1043 family protein [Halieaceae bacterium]
MEINNLIVAIIAFSVFAGIGIGVTFGRKSGRDSKKLRELETRLEKERQNMDLYEKRVLAHFSQTAQLVNKLTDSYRDVHKHLAIGAEDLCPPGESSETILQLEDTNRESSTQEDIKPPLDYAPKASPKQRGVLNESFGIEKDFDTEDHDINVKE